MAVTTTILHPHQLIPVAWNAQAGAGPVYTFNPALIDLGAQWLLAYRVVLADGVRRIALCRLSSDLIPVPGSAVPFSDQVAFPQNTTLSPQARTWFADPRLYRFAGRLFLHWNSGWHEPRNHQFLQEVDPLSLKPVGHPRELLLAGQRQPIEKNWTFWGEGPYFASYSPSPHCVMRFEPFGEGDLVFYPESEQPWNNRIYERLHGKLRGGAAPCRFGEHYLSVCHSMVGTRESGFDYHAAVFAFDATAPFTVRKAPHRPLHLGPLPERRNPSLNRAVARVLYPCGLQRSGDAWLVSFGINDELCAIARMTSADLLGTLLPVPAS